MKVLNKILRLIGRGGEEAEGESKEGECWKRREIEEEFPQITQEERAKHIGKHVAIADGKIVSSDKTAKNALSSACEDYPEDEIVLRYVGKQKVLFNCKCLEED